MEDVVLVCVKCGAVATDTRIGVDVQSGEVWCSGCDEEYTVADVRAIVASWGPLLAWIESHPANRPAVAGKVG